MSLNLKLQLKGFIFTAGVLFSILIGPSIVLAQDTANHGSSVFISSGISISNTEDLTLGERSYPSMELGFNKDGLSLALVTGRSDNNYSVEERLSNYWWEVKTAFCVPAGSFDVYGLLGVGNYMSTKRVFIEYGMGFSRTLGQVSYFAQISNWDNLWYITPGLTYTF